MGNFYTNYTLRGPSQKQVAQVLAGRSAIITPQQNGCVVVFDEASDDQDQALISGLAGELSNTLSCPVLAVLNHDDDIFWYELHINGKLVDEYNSSPDYFEATAEPQGPSGGDAKKLCEAFGNKEFSKVENVLRDKKTFAVEQHSDLVQALGIPEFSIGCGYTYCVRGELPEGLEEDDVIHLS